MYDVYLFENLRSVLNSIYIIFVQNCTEFEGMWCVYNKVCLTWK